MADPPAEVRQCILFDFDLICKVIEILACSKKLGLDKPMMLTRAIVRRPRHRPWRGPQQHQAVSQVHAITFQIVFVSIVASK